MTCAIISTGFENQLPCKNENEKPYPEIKRILRETIWGAYCNGYTDFYVNCEYGIPLWAAEIVCALKLYNTIKLHIIIPCEEQTTNWTEDQRDRYYDVHLKADSVVFADKQWKENCYHEADEMIINESDVVLILGADETCYAEIYAKRMEIPVQKIDCRM